MVHDKPYEPLVFRFTIREIALLTTIVALALGWGLDHWSSEMRAKQAKIRIDEMMRRLQVEARLQLRSTSP